MIDPAAVYDADQLAKAEDQFEPFAECDECGASLPDDELRFARDREFCSDCFIEGGE